MDLQRYLLIGAIAVLSFMLLTEWSNFQDERSSAAAAAQHQALQTIPPVPTMNNGIPDTLPPTATPSAGSDIPELAKPTTPHHMETSTASPARGHIHVRTDVLELQIDPVGGDIVYAAFPQHASSIKTPNIPFILLEDSPQRTYVAQSGLIGPNGIDTPAGRPRYHSAAQDYTLAENEEELTVSLVTDTPTARITKQFILHRGDYAVTVRYLIDNHGDTPWEGALFVQLKRDNSPDPGLSNKGFGLGMQSFLGAATRTAEDRYRKIKFGDMADKPLRIDATDSWIAMVQHYFISAWIPEPGVTQRFTTMRTSDGLNIIRSTSPMTTVAAGEQGVVDSTFYAGPKDQDRLKALAPGLELTVDYGFLWWLSQPLFWLLTKIHHWVGNWGWAIVAVTVLVKLAFFQLNATAYRSMANMRRMTPKMQEIRERYPDDRQKQSQAMMELYKKEKINPLGGCLPILVQMPVFLALYWVLLESVELRHAPWILWIKDLSVMDPYFILPILMGLSMFIQQKLNPAPPDPMQAKIMQWLPVIFTVFFLWFPAGLVLYWVVNNTLSIAQQYVITRRLANTP